VGRQRIPDKMSLLLISKKEGTIADLPFELEKLRKYFSVARVKSFLGPVPLFSYR